MSALRATFLTMSIKTLERHHRNSRTWCEICLELTTDIGTTPQKQYNKMWNMFKGNNKDIGTTPQKQ